MIMKKVLSTILVCILIVGSMLSLLSCGKTVSGTYEGRIDMLGLASYTVTYAFKGNNVEIKSQLSSSIGSLNPHVVNATYEIREDEDGNLSIVFDYGDADAEEGMEKEGVELPFVEGAIFILPPAICATPLRLNVLWQPDAKTNCFTGVCIPFCLPERLLRRSSSAISTGRPAAPLPETTSAVCWDRLLSYRRSCLPSRSRRSLSTLTDIRSKRRRKPASPHRNRLPTGNSGSLNWSQAVQG